MIRQLLDWLDRSTCNVMAVQTIERELKAAGFEELKLADPWSLRGEGKYYVVQNGTTVFAFVCGSPSLVPEAGFRIISSHSDSPCLKVKPNAEMYGEGGVLKLNVEKYGGPILYTWFDRPLGLSGRVALQTDDPLQPELRAIDMRMPVATIPHLAIHFNRAVNEGNPISVQRDMLPVAGIFSPEEIEEHQRSGGYIKYLLSRQLGVSHERILDYELCFYPLQNATLTGTNESLFQSGRIDDLSMAFASLRAMLDVCAKPSRATRVMAVFDNEETGSGTKQGAASPILATVLERVAQSMLNGCTPEEMSRAIANSFMISADDAHAWHPNYNTKYDPTNHALMGHGPAIKINANCKYMTDADSAAVFNALCRESGVPVQYFVNHSDVAGGSTLGNILTSQLPLRGVDMGAPIWAMHSAVETASVEDHKAVVKVFNYFWTLS